MPDDLETQIFKECSTAMRESFPDAMYVMEDGMFPAKFPTVKIREIGNVEEAGLRDSSNVEKGQLVSYEISAFADARKKGAREKAKEMARSGDAAMRSLGFERTFGQLVQDSDGKASAMRYIARYTGVARPDGNGNYQIYRR